jgi:hypothetical protein
MIMLKMQRNALHQFAAELPRHDLEQALKIIQSHHPEHKRIQRNTEVPKDPAERNKWIKDRIIQAQEKRARIEAEQAQAVCRVDLNKKIIEELHTQGLHPIFSHFFDCPYGMKEYKSLRATSCVIVNQQGEAEAKGTSIVSLLDNGSKLEGRYNSLGRALAALLTRSTGDPIVLNMAEENVQSLLDGPRVGAMTVWNNKSIWKPNVGELHTVELVKLARHRARVQKAT